MNTLRLVHSTRYEFEQPITGGELTARLRPRELPQHRVDYHQLIVRPETRPVVKEDSYGNQQAGIHIAENTALIEIHAITELAIGNGSWPDPADRNEWSGEPWEAVRDRLTAANDDAVSFLTCKGEMASTDVQRAARNYAQPFFTPGRPLVDAASHLAQAMREDFRTDDTAVETTPRLAEVFMQRAGVCQDRARAAITCLRTYGLAARYVGGYYSDGNSAQPHAWIALWLPGDRWINLDPSIVDQPDNCTRVTVGWAADAAELTPVSGNFHGGGRQRMTSAVHLEPLSTTRRQIL